MSGFSEHQLTALAETLARSAVQTRDLDGRTLHYIEGWFAIAEANAIFGFGGWDREMVHFERAFERIRGEMVNCGYIARVRIRVRTADSEIIREGTGFGAANARSAADAHERALKSAETDATKRALATFGNRFGLCLYDREQTGVANTIELRAADGQLLAGNLSPEGYCSGLRQLIDVARTYEEIDGLARYNARSIEALRARAPTLCNSRGEHYADIVLRLLQRRHENLRPKAVADEGREAANDAGLPPPAETLVSSVIQPAAIDADGNEEFSAANTAADQPANGAAVEQETGAFVEQSTGAFVEQGTGASDVPPMKPSGHGRLIGHHDPHAAPLAAANGKSRARPTPSGRKAKRLPASPSKIAEGDRIDKSALRFGYERRLRDKQHLKRIMELPCVVCNRQPSHPHHLKFAQRRGLSQKVSDEFVVPLCALHHGDLHRCAAERDWWARQSLDPLPIAARLWDERDTTTEAK